MICGLERWEAGKRALNAERGRMVGRAEGVRRVVLRIWDSVGGGMAVD